MVSHCLGVVAGGGFDGHAVDDKAGLGGLELMTLLDPLKDHPSICTITLIFRTLLMNLQFVRRLLVLDVPLNT